MFMSEVDILKRLEKYGGEGVNVEVRRISLLKTHLHGLPSFPASDKKKDPRYKWFIENCGDRCWELDAMDPNNLRASVEQAILELIEPEAWARYEKVNEAERESLRSVLDAWRGARPRPKIVS